MQLHTFKINYTVGTWKFSSEPDPSKRLRVNARVTGEITLKAYSVLHATMSLTRHIGHSSYDITQMYKQDKYGGDWIKL